MMTHDDQHLQFVEKLVLRESLIYWRAQQADRPWMTMEEGMRIWRILWGESFHQRLERGEFPDLATWWWDVLPLSHICLRLPALNHDIAYLLGGGEEDFRKANAGLRADIVSEYPSWYGRCVAWAVWRVVSWAGRTRFCWQPAKAQ